MPSKSQSLMKRIECVIRPHRLEQVKNALSDAGVQGLTVLEARGCGSSPEARESFGGLNYVIALPLRLKLEMVVPNEQVESVVKTVLRHARTGWPGDGKIFISTVGDVLRVRTGARGETSL